MQSHKGHSDRDPPTFKPKLDAISANFLIWCAPAFRSLLTYAVHCVGVPYFFAGGIAQSAFTCVHTLFIEY